MTIRITKAAQEDVKALTQASKAAFDDDVNFGAPQKGGPPGYASENWHLRMILTCDVYKIEVDGGHFDRLSDHSDRLSDHSDRLSDHSDRRSGQIVGGIIVYQKGFRHMELGRIFIHPGFQNQGIGRQAIRFLEETYSETDLWTLDTPKWNRRNQHFYQTMGYEPTGQEGPGGLWFVKHMTSEMPRRS